MEREPKGIIRVLIVEDSPTTAIVLQSILNADPEIMVIGMAKDGEEAIKLTDRYKPDLITMDVHLPRLNGLEATKEIMATRPTPILILSGSVFTRKSENVFDAFSYGAVDVVNKNDALSPDRPGTPHELIQKIKFLSQVKVIHHPLGRLPQKNKKKPREVLRAGKSERLIAIVGSTGAPQAISEILRSIPASFPCGIVIMIHLSPGFTDGFVQWLQGSCTIRVKVGTHGEPIHPGVSYVAPTGFHMRVTKEKTIELGDDPAVNALKPCGDYLLESVAKHYQEGSIGVVLTGMGRDGMIGIGEVKKYGGATIAQDEKTSAIFGMPKVAVETGKVDLVLPLNRIAGEIMILMKKEMAC